MPMKNREKILWRAIYDFLVTLNQSLKRYGYGGCIIHLITGRSPCLSGKDGKCEDCIGIWLNKEDSNE